MHDIQVIKLKISSPNYKLLLSKLMFIYSFCKIYKIHYIQKNLKKFQRRYTILRSPHIHKKTWQNYLIKYNFRCVQVYVPNNKLINFFILLKILSFNVQIKLTVLKKCN